VRAVCQGADCLRDQPSVEFGVGAEAATASSARRKAWGRSLPHLSARRRIPAQAFGLKKNRSGTVPVSKVADNEHTAASLGHSEILSVQDSVAHAIPEFDHAPEDGTKVPSSVR